MKELLSELKKMSTLEGIASLEKAKEIRARFNSPEEREFIVKYMNNELDAIENDIKTVNATLDHMLSIKE